MNNIEQNALRIAELLGYKERVNSTIYRLFDIPKNLRKGDASIYPMDVLISRYSSYDRLMEIIESEISEYELKSIHFELDCCGLLETVQKYVIQYLELKNDSRTN